MIGQKYIKDGKTGALLNINTKEFEDLKHRRNQNKQLKELENRVANLESQVLKFSDSLKAVLEKLSVVSD